MFFPFLCSSSCMSPALATSGPPFAVSIIRAARSPRRSARIVYNPCTLMTPWTTMSVSSIVDSFNNASPTPHRIVAIEGDHVVP